MCDSMVKVIYGWELSDGNEKNCSEAFQRIDNRRYDEPPLKDNPDRFIIHMGTNDLISDQDPETIGRNIIEIVNNSKTDTNKVLIPNIVSST